MDDLKRVYEAYNERFPDECEVDNIQYYFDDVIKLYFVLGNQTYNISVEDKNINNIIELIKSW